MVVAAVASAAASGIAGNREHGTNEGEAAAASDSLHPLLIISLRQFPPSFHSA